MIEFFENNTCFSRWFFSITPNRNVIDTCIRNVYDNYHLALDIELIF